MDARATSRYYASRLLPYLAAFMGVETALRVVLAACAHTRFSPGEWARIFLLGAYFDAVVAAFALLPVVLYLALLPGPRHGGAGDRAAGGLGLTALIFLLVLAGTAEYLFWDEFSSRFNFIAVDYLVYSSEVLGNIRQSYPVGAVIGAVAACSLLLGWPLWRTAPALPPGGAPTRRQRWAALAFAGLLALGAYAATDVSWTQWSTSQEANELSGNGIYDFLHAYRHNELDYEGFYLTADRARVEERMRGLLSRGGSQFAGADQGDPTRVIAPKGPELRKNVMLVMLESMSPGYMDAFGHPQSWIPHMTPNLDALAKEGLFFTRLYATGTRTVRGMEAVALSVPPTPGHSILRRPGNDGLSSLGFVFRDRGYDARFIYGGYGYFDDMNRFFSGNGFEVLDRAAIPKEEIHFANIWGVCDEDLFTQALRAADKSYAAKKPFFNWVMTTSNHRPYTYPEGRIDIPPRQGREGGIKYSDYAVGRLVAEARLRPWFKDTVFVFVADHTAGASGRLEMDLEKFHIPLIVYSPGFIRPRRFEKEASQIDLAPALLGLLNFRYYSRFLGEDVLGARYRAPRFFIATYQRLGYWEKGRLVVLSPGRGVSAFDGEKKLPAGAVDRSVLDDAVAYYQYSSDWRRRFRRLPTTVLR